MAETSQIAVSTQTLSVEEIVQEVLRIERECAEALQADEQGRFRELLRKRFRGKCDTKKCQKPATLVRPRVAFLPNQ